MVESREIQLDLSHKIDLQYTINVYFSNKNFIGDDLMKNLNWPIKVFFITFLLAAVFSGATNLVADLNIWALSIVLIFVIFIGIIFDMIGVAALTSKKENFHAMAAKKIKGSKEAITLLNNSNMVATVCNDVVGDICGIISGGFGALLSIAIATNTSLSLVVSSIIVTAFISALTVGGKAHGKIRAMKNADKIIFRVAKLKKMLSIK